MSGFTCNCPACAAANDAKVADRDAEIARLRAELAKAREVPAGVEEAIAVVVAQVHRHGIAAARLGHPASGPAAHRAAGDGAVTAERDLRTAIAREVTAADQRGRESGRAEVLAMAPEVEAAIEAVAASAQRVGRSLERDDAAGRCPSSTPWVATLTKMDALRAAIAAAQARAVEAARQGMRAAVGAAEANLLIDTYTLAVEGFDRFNGRRVAVRAALLAALTGGGRP